MGMPPIAKTFRQRIHKLWAIGNNCPSLAHGYARWRHKPKHTSMEIDRCQVKFPDDSLNLWQIPALDARWPFKGNDATLGSHATAKVMEHGKCP